MRVFFHPDFLSVYAPDPAAAEGRLEAVVAALEGEVDWEAPRPAADADIAAVHTVAHLEGLRQRGLYPIAALAAGAAVQAAEAGLAAPAFALARPPGHHASAGHAWGFCFVNHMAVALERLQRAGRIHSALVLDIDLHYGDGTDNILGPRGWARIVNPPTLTREGFLAEVTAALAGPPADLIGVSAGFDAHRADWGGLLTTADYAAIGAGVRATAARWGAGAFGILEGGYNHAVLGGNVRAFLRGLDGRPSG